MGCEFGCVCQNVLPCCTLSGFGWDSDLFYGLAGMLLTVTEGAFRTPSQAFKLMDVETGFRLPLSAIPS